MMEYDKLIEQILNVPILQGVVDTEEAKGKFLNLVSADWKNRLNEYDVLNRYNIPSERLFRYVYRSAFGETQLINDEKDKLFLMLVLPCCFPYKCMDSTFSIYVEKTEPLSIIAKTLTSDINYKFEIAKEFKFFMELCNLQNCDACIHCCHQFESAGYKIENINPCIHNTCMYTKKKIAPRFGSTIKQIFGNKKFLSICLIEINRRIIHHKNDCNTPIIRIGAEIHKMIAIDKSIIRNKATIPFIGHLEPFIDSAGKPVGGKKRRQDSSNQSTSRKMTKKEQKEEEERMFKIVTTQPVFQTLDDSSDE